MENAQFHDDELVYVDPERREVLGRVEWDRSGRPKSRRYPKDENRKVHRKYYPFGRYETMCRIYRLNGAGGGERKAEEGRGGSLDEVLPFVLRDEL